MVLLTEPVSRRNTVVGGACAPPSALLVLKWFYLLEQAVVLKWFYSLRRRKTFVGGKCALSSAVQVDYFLYRALEAACAACASLHLSLLHNIDLSRPGRVKGHFNDILGLNLK